jgi:hypothetical protein
MLKRLYISPTDDLPGVILDPKTGEFRIWGRVLPEDGNKFFKPILEWVEEYVEHPNDETIFYFKLDYYNSSTARMLTKLIVILEHIQEVNKKVKVVWEHSKEDEGMEERGDELKSISYLPFELRAY